MHVGKHVVHSFFVGYLLKDGLVKFDFLAPLFSGLVTALSVRCVDRKASYGCKVGMTAA